jgi:hypothetical protein
MMWWLSDITAWVKMVVEVERILVGNINSLPGRR